MQPFCALQSTVHFCKSYRVPVLQVSPRFKVNVEVAYDTNTTVFNLFDRDMNLLIKKTCEELLTQSLEDVSEDGYPLLLDSLIDRKMLFKVETKVQQAVQFERSYPMRRVCADEDIIAMFDLSGADFPPTKQIDPDILMTHISLGNDDFGSGLKGTPAKRKLDA